jgi:hypothetical protein
MTSNVELILRMIQSSSVNDTYLINQFIDTYRIRTLFNEYKLQTYLLYIDSIKHLIMNNVKYKGLTICSEIEKNEYILTTKKIKKKLLNNIIFSTDFLKFPKILIMEHDNILYFFDFTAGCCWCGQYRSINNKKCKTCQEYGIDPVIFFLFEQKYIFQT